MHPLKDRWTLPRKSPVTLPSPSQSKEKGGKKQRKKKSSTTPLPIASLPWFNPTLWSLLLSVEKRRCTVCRSRKGHQPCASFKDSTLWYLVSQKVSHLCMKYSSEALKSGPAAHTYRKKKAKSFQLGYLTTERGEEKNKMKAVWHSQEQACVEILQCRWTISV